MVFNGEWSPRISGIHPIAAQPDTGSRVMHRLELIITPLFWISLFWLVVALALMALRRSVGGRSVGWHIMGAFTSLLFWASLVIVGATSLGAVTLHVPITLPFWK
jgi:hypothetical protein